MWPFRRKPRAADMENTFRTTERMPVLGAMICGMPVTSDILAAGQRWLQDKDCQENVMAFMLKHVIRQKLAADALAERETNTWCVLADVLSRSQVATIVNKLTQEE